MPVLLLLLTLAMPAAAAPLALPAAPRFTARADERHVWVSWDGGAAEVTTTVVGGAYVWQRAIAPGPTHVEVRDTVTNPSDAATGLHVQHAFTPAPGPVRLGGRDDPDLADAYSPWNPTVFGPLGRGGLGLVAEDDVFRQQLRVARAGPALGLRTDMLCLGPRESRTLVWSIYPTRTGRYWDFLNTLRRDWGVNRTIAGAYIWFTPDGILAMPDTTLRERLARQNVAVASMWGGWVDPRRPAVIGFGTAVLRAEFADLRRRLGAAVAKLHAARPGITVLAYFDAQRDSSPDAPRRYGASLLVGPGDRVERTDWGGRYSPTWGMVPTTADRFGQKMRRVAHVMRRLGADGLYWDEMDGVDYRAPRVTRGRWDGASCLLAADGRIEARVGLVNLLGEEAKLGYAEAGFVLGNMPPTTRRFQDRADLRMVEAHHEGSWAPFAHLSTPLGYLGGERRDWAMVIATLEQGLLPAGTRLDYDYDLPARLFPFTPEYVEPGTLVGRERIVTTRSGTHGWLGWSGPVRVFRYDATGHEYEASWHVKHRPGGVVVRVRLERDEAALIERSP